MFKGYEFTSLCNDTIGKVKWVSACGELQERQVSQDSDTTYVIGALVLDK